MTEKEVYIVKTEPNAHDGELDVPIFDVYENKEEAKEHNREGHWSDHALYTATYHE
jgi:hypothetical protein